MNLFNLFKSKPEPTQEVKDSEPAFKVSARGTDYFVTDVESLFNSKQVQKQAKLASQHVARQKSAS